MKRCPLCGGVCYWELSVIWKWPLIDVYTVMKDVQVKGDRTRTVVSVGWHKHSHSLFGDWGK